MTHLRGNYAPVALSMREKSAYSNTSPFAMTGIESAETMFAIQSHFAGTFGLSATFLIAENRNK